MRQNKKHLLIFGLLAVSVVNLPAAFGQIVRGGTTPSIQRSQSSRRECVSPTPAPAPEMIPTSLSRMVTVPARDRLTGEEKTIVRPYGYLMYLWMSTQLVNDDSFRNAFFEALPKETREPFAEAFTKMFDVWKGLKIRGDLTNPGSETAFEPTDEEAAGCPCGNGPKAELGEGDTCILCNYPGMQ